MQLADDMFHSRHKDIFCLAHNASNVCPYLSVPDSLSFAAIITIAFAHSRHSRHSRRPRHSRQSWHFQTIQTLQTVQALQPSQTFNKLQAFQTFHTLQTFQTTQNTPDNPHTPNTPDIPNNPKAGAAEVQCLNSLAAKRYDTTSVDVWRLWVWATSLTRAYFWTKLLRPPRNPPFLLMWNNLIGVNLCGQ